MRETVRAWIHGKLVGVDCWMFLMTPYKASQEFHMRLNCATRAQCTQWRNDVSKRESNRPLGSPMMSLQKYSLKRRKWPLCVCAYQGRENWGEKPIERNGSPSRERLLLLLRFCFYRERATSGTRIQGWRIDSVKRDWRLSFDDTLLGRRWWWSVPLQYILSTLFLSGKMRTS